LKEKALDRIKWRNRFGRGCGPVVWQITDDDAYITYTFCLCTTKPQHKNSGKMLLDMLKRSNSLKQS
jgi:hypothetical protein